MRESRRFWEWPLVVPGWLISSTIWLKIVLPTLRDKIYLSDDRLLRFSINLFIVQNKVIVHTMISKRWPVKMNYHEIDKLGFHCKPCFCYHCREKLTILSQDVGKISPTDIFRLQRTSNTWLIFNVIYSIHYSSEKFDFTSRLRLRKLQQMSSVRVKSHSLLLF